MFPRLVQSYINSMSGYTYEFNLRLILMLIARCYVTATTEKMNVETKDF